MSCIADYGKQRIRTAIENGSLSHAVLITGDSYICAELVRYAASLLFDKSESEADEIQDFFYADGKTLRVADTEELLNEINVTPNSGVRLISVRNAGYMSQTVQNMLLKTVEEPPPRNHFFFYGNESGLLPTIRSRCAVLVMGQPDYDSIAEYVQKQGASQSDALYYAKLGGAVETAIRLYSDEEYRNFCMECAAYICTMGRCSLFSDRQRDIAAVDAQRAAEIFDLALSDMFRLKLNMEPVFFTRSPQREDIRECAGRLTEKELNAVRSYVLEMRKKLFVNAPAKQLFDNFAAKTEQVIYDGRK